MEKLKIALLQMGACGIDQDANRQKGEDFCRKAKKLGANIALFPEMWNIGYRFPKPWGIPQEIWEAQAINKSGDFVAHFQKLAKELEMAICITYLERDSEAFKNLLSLIDRSGTVVLNYSKVHTCAFGFESVLTPGDGFYVSELDVGFEKIKIGAMICYDREFPESARVLMLKGAEIILVPNCCELEVHRTQQIATRAFENMVGIAVANHVWPGRSWHSIAVDAMAFDEKGNSIDNIILETDTAEGVYIAEFDIEKNRKYREREPWGAAYRKPQCYGSLVSEKVPNAAG